MKSLYLFSLLFFISVGLYAQTANVSGSISRVNNTPMPNVMVSAIDENGNTVQSTVSQPDGSYSFSGLPVPAVYTIQPHYDGAAIEDVTTFDVVIGARHILGIESLSSPYSVIAGDVNASQNFTTFDLIQMRKIILNIESAFTAGSWRFMDANFQFPNPNNPFEDLEIGNIEVQLTTDVSDLDITGIKVGNLNL